MEELYTFNSEQLDRLSSHSLIQASSNRYRNRLLSNKFSKKPTRTTILLNKSKDNIGSKSQIGSMKKVQFKQTLLYLNQAQKPENHNSIPDQPAVIMYNKDKVIQNLKQETCKTRTVQEYTSPIKKYLKRAFSVTQRSSKLQNKVLLEQNNNLDIPLDEPNIKKSTSFRASPKINIKLTNKKLPSDFKTKFGEKYIQKIKNKDTQRENQKKLTEDYQKFKRHQQNNDPVLTQMKNINKMLLIESKLFDHLYKPIKR